MVDKSQPTNIPSTARFLGSNLYNGNSYVQSVTLPSTIDMLNGSTFGYCSNLEKVNLSDTAIKTIPSYTFYNCSKLSEVLLPQTITNIETSTFQNCTNLSRISLPDNIVSIGSSAFYSCSKLTTSLPTKLANIGNSAFYNCYYLKSVSIPNIENLGSYAFYNTGILSISLPAAIQIGSARNLFGSRIAEIRCADEATRNLFAAVSNYYPSDTRFLSNTDSTSIFTKDDFEIFSTSTGYKLLNYTGSSSTITLPISYNNTTLSTIRQFAFQACPTIKSMTIPDNYTTIEPYAFQYCYNLETLRLPTTLSSVSYSMFYGCEYLKNLYINTPYSVNLKNTNFGYSSPDFKVVLQSNVVSLVSSIIPSYTKELDFENCSFTTIPKSTFYDIDLKTINLANCPTITTIESSAFNCC